MISITVGFVCDHVEIMYDIDIEAQAAAREHGGYPFARDRKAR
jgi:protoheme ferro-lyase